MSKMNELSQAELAQVSGGAYRMAFLQLAGWSRKATANSPYGGGVPGGPLAEAGLAYCAAHPEVCNNIPPTQPRD